VGYPSPSNTPISQIRERGLIHGKPFTCTETSLLRSRTGSQESTATASQAEAEAPGGDPAPRGGIASGAAMHIIHHGNKPSRDPGQGSAWKGRDFAYFGSGSSDMANWARATVLLREVEEGLFELRLSKRGTRAGMLKSGSGCRSNQICTVKHQKVASSHE
jgi:hypothetical protein